MNSSTTTTKTENQSSTGAFKPDPTLMKEWQDVLGTGGGLADYLVNNLPPQASVAGPTDLTKQWWQQAGAMGGAAPDFSGQQTGLAAVSGNIANQQVDPNTINLPSNFNFAPGALDFNNPFAAGVPNVTAPGGVSGNYRDYLAPVQNVQAGTVSAQNVTAPGAVAPISGLMQVAAPQLRQYQFDPAMMQQVSAQDLQKYQMQAAAPVAPSGQVGAGSFTAPGIAQAYMNPYAQQVVDVQSQKAVQDWQQALQTQRSQAAAAGAYGGDRQAVEEATGQRDLQLQLAQIQATGLQNAYQQGQQQFNTEQQLGMQGQQFNVGTALQASLANQQAQQQANVQNLSAYLQTQGLQAQTGLQAALANQQAGLTVGGQNLQSQLQTQGLGAQTGMQAQLANQQQGLQAALANQQAQELQTQEQMQASLANQQANLAAGTTNAQLGLQGQLANQQANLQSQEAARQMGLQGAQFTAGQGLQAGLANQAAQMQAMGIEYQGGLQGALQTQALGMQGQMAGAQMGLTAAQQQEALRQAQIGLNLQGAGMQTNLLNTSAGMQANAYQLSLAGNNALMQAAQAQQGMAQQQSDVAYQNAMQNMMTPLQAENYLASLLSMQPVPYTTSGTQQGTTQLTQPGPSFFSQLFGGLIGAAGMASGLGYKPFGAEGGLVDERGIGAIEKARGGPIHEDAAADRAQVLGILRERGLIRKRTGGGLGDLAWTT
jgi:hypothetical protein